MSIINGYLNFLHSFQREHPFLPNNEALRQGAQCWVRLSNQAKSKYRRRPKTKLRSKLKPKPRRKANLRALKPKRRIQRQRRPRRKNQTGRTRQNRPRRAPLKKPRPPMVKPKPKYLQPKKPQCKRYPFQPKFQPPENGPSHPLPPQVQPTKVIKCNKAFETYLRLCRHKYRNLTSDQILAKAKQAWPNLTRRQRTMFVCQRCKRQRK